MQHLIVDVVYHIYIYISIGHNHWVLFKRSRINIVTLCSNGYVLIIMNYDSLLASK